MIEMFSEDIQSQKTLIKDLAKSRLEGLFKLPEKVKKSRFKKAFA